MVDILHRIGIKASMDEVYQALAAREGVETGRGNPNPDDVRISNWH